MTSDLRNRNRVKGFVIGSNDLIALLSAATSDYQYVALPKLKLPDGFEVVDVQYRAEWRGFVVIVRHESFPPVALGCMVPIDGELNRDIVAFIPPTGRAATDLEREIEAEQEHGRQKYGDGPHDLEHDDQHAPADWVRFIRDHTERAARNTPQEYRQHLVKVAGLAKSAVEAFDRKAEARS